jgi:predicted RNase H-like HicB family nuclease
MSIQDGDRELVYTLQLQELRPGDFVARAPSFPTMLVLGDTADEAIGRATSLLGYYLREARAQGEPAPADVAKEPVDGQWLVFVHVGA